MTKIIRHSKTLEKEIKVIQNSKINFIPTMGNLHNGHLSLIKAAKKNNFLNIVSIFVNPLQFNEKKDFINYPRTLKKDIEIYITQSWINFNQKNTSHHRHKHVNSIISSVIN